MDDLEERSDGGYFNNLMDPEHLTEDWLLTKTPYPITSCLIVYLLILRYGPRLMEGRNAFHLKTVMRLYNLLQVWYNGWFLYGFLCQRAEIVPALLDNLCSLEQDPSQYQTLKREFLVRGWHYLALKLLDLLDTIFMILRKKNSHVTVLHTYHHVGMPFFSWIAFHFSKSHHMVFPALVNVVVHMIMYSYYFLATFSVLKRWLWWKQYLTRLQLSQFVVVLLYIFLLHHNGCTIPRMFAYLWLMNVTVILLLFVNFYIQAYVRPSQNETL